MFLPVVFFLPLFPSPPPRVDVSIGTTGAKAGFVVPDCHLVFYPFPIERYTSKDPH